MGGGHGHDHGHDHGLGGGTGADSDDEEGAEATVDPHVQGKEAALDDLEGDAEENLKK